MAEEHHHDPTFYRSPSEAAAGPPEKLAYVAAYSHPADHPAGRPDAIAVVDTDPESASYASVVGFTELPHLGDELHHFGWNACSSALCPTGSHTHGDRRYLVVQIAGALARRIVCARQPGDRLARGERFGMIMFGSRVDVFLPPGVEPRVARGDRVRAGQTVIAQVAAGG